MMLGSYQPVYLGPTKYNFTFPFPWWFRSYHGCPLVDPLANNSGNTVCQWEASPCRDDFPSYYYNLQVQSLRLIKHAGSNLSQIKEFTVRKECPPLGPPAFSKHSLKPFPFCAPHTFISMVVTLNQTLDEFYLVLLTCLVATLLIQAFLVLSHHLNVIYYVSGFFCASAGPDTGRRVLYSHGDLSFLIYMSICGSRITNHNLMFFSLCPEKD